MTAPMKVDLPHVTPRENDDGTVRYYFRRRGYPFKRLPGTPFSPEFMEAYERLMNWTPDGKHTVHGSFAWLCDQYMDSTDFTSKMESTRNARRRIIVAMMKEPIAPGFSDTFGDERADKIKAKHIRVLRDRKASNANAGNERIKVLSQVFKFAIDNLGWEGNPTRDVKRLAVKEGGHDTATDEQIKAYFDKHPTGPAWLAMKLLTYFGYRVSDLRVSGRQHIRNGYLVFDTIKTGVRCELEIEPDMLAILPDNGEQMTFLLNAYGKPYDSDKALSQRVSKWFRQAGVEGITAHSVRKWVATRMAENGATELELMSWMGWKDPKEARPYIQAANRKKMASSGRAKISGV